MNKIVGLFNRVSPRGVRCVAEGPVSLFVREGVIYSRSQAWNCLSANPQIVKVCSCGNHFPTAMYSFIFPTSSRVVSRLSDRVMDYVSQWGTFLRGVGDTTTYPAMDKACVPIRRQRRADLSQVDVIQLWNNDARLVTAQRGGQFRCMCPIPIAAEQCQ